MNIDKRLEELRSLMKDRKIDAYIVASSDPHQSEYLADHYKTREFISGFTGSAGTAVITLKEARLWTDSRYFLQAQKELATSEFELMKMGVEGYPTILEYLDQNIAEFGKIGFDGKCYSVTGYKELSENMGARILVSDLDYISQIWTDRPELPKDKAWIHDEKYCGLSLKDKLTILREKMSENDSDYTFIGAPEDICYLLNIRGNDVDFNPVILSYMLVSQDKAYLCIDEDKLEGSVRDYLEENDITIYSYDYIYTLLKNIPGKNRIYLDPARTNVAVYDSINSNVKISQGTNLTTYMKSIKTDTEIENIKKAYILDGVSLVKFFNWLEVGAKTGSLNELVASNKLHDLRAENESFIEDSFETIAGYKENAAIVHYAPSKTGSKTIRDEGLILVDSGGHYKEGTTDITRTIALGSLRENEKIDYTLVLKSFLSLFLAKFKNRTKGSRLDMIAKYPLWKAGKDFFHGTGHGVGFVLTVHEGPQAISERNEVEFVENMTTSIEPGLYIENSHGIRIENEAYVKKAFDNEFGHFLEFETLTYVPLDTRPIKSEMLSTEEIDWVNAYNRKCYELLSPYLEGHDLDYLKESCKEI
ncbi:aminopeptidase P family protein [Anaerococcus degeneri]|uniref:Aminopeptidase P family protein n=1 Tax=Anaerococcus degeneri TaxID=361500 RepID=A0ABS7YUJ0_9FIRM|nr:aminopeptidase P family protein [Anaerococcus degeneri]MBP2015134.1 Xaa-Pro aminopeptidase [Anaerococcus degeneri]MCA2095394.1 aminopeptidase P family protein [Anaerococcus degeneri]